MSHLIASSPRASSRSLTSMNVAPVRNAACSDGPDVVVRREPEGREEVVVAGVDRLGDGFQELVDLLRHHGEGCRQHASVRNREATLSDAP
jgi:hypothetical protein